MSDVRDKVLQALKDSDEPLKGGEIAEATGLDKKDVDKAIKKLKTDGLIGSPKRCYYAPAGE
ncbi:MAG: HTH domain-containing protein [bacterium]|nr:HTH domain-containing protein [bacterium]